MSTSEHETQTPPTSVTRRQDSEPLTTIRAGWARRGAIDRLSGVYVWLLLVLLFAIWVPDTFLTSSTVRTIGSSSAVTSIVALALILPLACGLFDLSVAATLGVAAVLALQLQADGVGVAPSVLLTLLAGVLIGVVNAVLVVRIGINSFIATLGMSSVLAALSFWISDGTQLVAAVPSSYVDLGQGTFLGMPNPVWYAIAIGVVLLYVTELTTVGRYLYAIGGNTEAARLVGIRVDRVLFGSLVFSAVLAAFAGIVLSAQLGSSSPDVGPPYLLPAFSAVLLGATQIKTNGRVNVVGTLVAVVLLATGIFGLQLAGAPSFISSLFNGVALIVAVALSLRANRGR
ncbi:MAG: ABC transporter permease [Aeromicrobium sp.]